MSKEEKIEKEGLVVEALPNLLFKVQLDDGSMVDAKLAGKLRMYRIKVLPGDKVTVELSAYDESKGRITWRGEKK